MRSFLLLVMVFLLIGCDFYPKPKEEDLAKYPSMEVFLPGRQDFKGIKHDYDGHFYSFSFKTKYDKAEFFRLVDSGAVAAGWSIAETEEESRTYRRPSEAYPAAQGEDIVVLKYASKSRRVTFEEKGNQ